MGKALQHFDTHGGKPYTNFFSDRGEKPYTIFSDHEDKQFSRFFDDTKNMYVLFQNYEHSL